MPMPTIAPLLGLLLPLGSLPRAPAADAAPHGAEILRDLREAFAARPAEEAYDVYAVLADRLRGRDLAGSVEGLPRGQRQRFVADTLRAYADARQGRLRALLDELAERGEVEAARPLWIANGMRFRGTRAAIEAVAALPEVERVGWSPPRPAEELQDAVGGSTIFFAEDFESGAGLPPEMKAAAAGCGYAEVTDEHGPLGAYHVVMASGQDGCAGTASLTLTVDLSATDSAQLRFHFADFTDDFDPGADVLEASDDGGATWVPIDDLDDPNPFYVVRTYDLDPLGLDYVADFRIRWSWSDNFGPPADGFGIDNVLVGDVLPPVPPPDPEPGLVGLQAPALWDLGYDGTGVVVLNIDAGVQDEHPDLADRIWSNPADPPDGLDNDGNGYVDDVHGWDFFSDDNDPDPASDPHGTNTAGILVGDGSAGIHQTGMAPGAELAVARVDSELDHWEALQWGISVGVDCSSSSYSYKWYFLPPPDYAMHREVVEMVLAAGIVHANSTGNDGLFGGAPVPFNVAAPALAPGPWRHPQQSQEQGGVSAVLACGAIEFDDEPFAPSGQGPSAWEDLTLYDPDYPHPQDPAYWDYPVGGFGGTLQGLLKPDVVTYTFVTTTTNGGGYATFGGTSAATPHLGGALALLLSAQPHAAPRHVAQALEVTAEDLGPPGKDPTFGSGKVQVLDAAKRLLHLVRVSDVAPKLGSRVTFEYYGTPGQRFASAWSLAGYGATPVGALGQLDLAEARPFLQGTLDAAGEYRLTVDVPLRPVLAGVELFVQSIGDDTAGRTGEVLFSTVESLRIGG